MVLLFKATNSGRFKQLVTKLSERSKLMRPSRMFPVMIVVSILSFAVFLSYLVSVEAFRFRNWFNVDANAITLYAKNRTTFANILGTYSNEFLTHSEKAEPIPYLRYDPKTDTFNSDLLINTPNERTHGNITGYGKVYTNELKNRELSLAEHLNPYFDKIYQTVPNITWLYYTSASGFNNLFPFISSSEFTFTEESLQGDYWKLGTLSNNPSRVPYWSKPYVDRAGKGMMVTLSAPVDYRGKYVGTVSLDMTVQQLSNGLNQHYTSFLCDENGQIIATSRNEYLSSSHVSNIRQFLGDTNYQKEFLVKSNDVPQFKNELRFIKRSIPFANWTFYYFLTPSDYLRLFGLKCFLMLSLLGALVWISILFDKKRKAEQQLISAVGTLESREKELEVLTSTDPLTGALNRRGLDRALSIEIERSMRTHQPICFLLFDIDRFKNINDTYGHEVGDVVLKETADVIGSSIRKTDYLSRWGGEEFLVLLTGSPYEASLKVAEMLRQKIEEHDVPFHDHSLHFTITCGVSRYDPSLGLSKSINRADLAMYLGKNRSRNIVVGEHELGEQPC